MASVDAQLAQLQAQLNDLSKSMQLAKQTGQLVALAAFKDQFVQLTAQAATLRARASTSDRPSALMLALDRFSDQALAVAADIGGAGSDLVKTTRTALGAGGTLLSILPWLVVAVVAGAIYWAVKGGLKLRVNK